MRTARLAAALARRDGALYAGRMKPAPARTLAAAAAVAAAASLLVPSAAFASDGTIKATVSKTLAQLAAHQTALTQLQALLAPGTPAAKLRAAAKSAVTEGTVLGAAATKARAALAKQKPSTAKGAAAKATCLTLFTGAAKLAAAVVAWGKTAAGRPDAAAAKRLQTGGMALLRSGIACQTATAALK